MKKELIDQSTQSTSAAHVKNSPIFYPDERLVAFFAGKMKSIVPNQILSGLDVGFGSGRHLKLMIDNKINTYGIEYTQEAVDKANQLIPRSEYMKSLWLGDYREFHFPIKFDILVAWGVIFHSTYDEMASCLSVMSRLLNSNGSIFINFRTKENWFNGLGEDLGGGSFLLDDRAGTYAGYCYTFMDLSQIENLVQKVNMKINKIERLDLWKNSLKEQNSWYICEIAND
jgi:cyclopropane fatty-acyl-phospholipid synthase-like methyltransferase